MEHGIRLWGLTPGHVPTGKNNSITDVAGVKVGHYTLHDEEHHTGITVILPRNGIYEHRCIAACDIVNGFGKTTGLIQIEELGQLESPIVLTNTLNVGLAYDALVQYTIDEREKLGKKLKSFNAVVAECNDSGLNKIYERKMGYKQLMHAIRHADENTTEGNIGAGAGMICHGLKGGIGTASRIIQTGKKDYTLGVLALCNHGMLGELNILGVMTGTEIIREIKRQNEAEEIIKADDKGSCVMVLATDLPLSSRQLKRVVKRCGAGLARVGSFWGHGSGDIAIGFTTAADLCRNEENEIISIDILNENIINAAFAAACECAQECVLNALASAEAIEDCHSLSEFKYLLKI